MTQSLDPTILAATNSINSSMTSSVYDPYPSTTNNGNLYNDQSAIPIVNSSGPLVTNSKMMPVPESLMSPDCGPPTIIQQRPVSTLVSTNTKTTRYGLQQRPSSTPSPNTKATRSLKKPEKSSPLNSPRKAMANTSNTKIHQNPSILKQTVQHAPHEPLTTTEDEEDDTMDGEKLRSLRKVAHKSQKQLENNHQVKKPVENKEAEQSAILIQKLWRGYSTRKRTVNDIAGTLQQKRTQDYIVKLTEDMEMTKQALENERKIQQLQM